MLELASLPKCCVTISGATFDASITFEEWADVLKRAVKVKEAIQWVIGDGINYGHTRWVEEAGVSNLPITRMKYKVAIESLPYEYQTLRDYSWVASRVPMSSRDDKLSFRHHRAVAPLPQRAQRKYLKLAAANHLSVADLNQLIRESESESSGHDSGPALRPGGLEWVGRASTWAAQQNPADWSVERCRVVANDLRPQAELYRRLEERLACKLGPKAV